jgi:hypothetical protein
MFDWRHAPLRGLHLCSALVIAAFLILHMGNHLIGLTGQQAHIAFMAAARRFYRNEYVEPLLLMLVAWQAISGVIMVVRGWKARDGKVAWLQALSGLYLAFFLLNHVGAVVAGRALFGLDTDFRFAAAGFFVPPWPLFFAPYYFLAVWCLFIHVGCALFWHLGQLRPALRRRVLSGFVAGGAIIALLIVLSLAGVLYPVDIPDAYRATYRF